MLVDGSQLDADLVVYGTGFAKNYDIFDKVIQSKLNIQKDGLYLYRNLVVESVTFDLFRYCRYCNSYVTPQRSAFRSPLA